MSPRWLALAVIAACSSRSTPPATPPSNTTDDAMPTAPLVAPEIEVIARVLETGPLGHGNCTQRSYRVEMVETTAGEALPSPSWVHFEICGGARPKYDASSLVIGSRYRLVLKRGASSNFANDPMIVDGGPSP
jgi:hypothetical protein